MMKSLAIILVALVALSNPAFAGGGKIQLASGGCASAAARAAADTGGTVIGVSQRGNTCVVTVLIAGSNGQPPKRVRVNYPAG